MTFGHSQRLERIFNNCLYDILIFLFKIFHDCHLFQYWSSLTSCKITESKKSFSFYRCNKNIVMHKTHKRFSVRIRIHVVFLLRDKLNAFNSAISSQHRYWSTLEVTGTTHHFFQVLPRHLHDVFSRPPGISHKFL